MSIVDRRAVCKQVSLAGGVGRLRKSRLPKTPLAPCSARQAPIIGSGDYWVAFGVSEILGRFSGMTIRLDAFCVRA